MLPTSRDGGATSVMLMSWAGSLPGLRRLSCREREINSGNSLTTRHPSSLRDPASADIPSEPPRFADDGFGSNQAVGCVAANGLFWRIALLRLMVLNGGFPRPHNDNQLMNRFSSGVGTAVST